MEKIYGRTKTIQEDKVSGFCPGCMHSTVIKLIGEVLEEMDLVDRAACVLGIGCCGLHMDYIAYDNTTAPHGRDPKEHGYPMHMCESLNQLTAPAYLVRTSCNTPANVNKTKQAIHKAFQNQLDGKGFSMVEVLSSCPTNWGMTPLEALERIRTDMIPYYPLGNFKDF
mgnify:CR=1 FL=1